MTTLPLDGDESHQKSDQVCRALSHRVRRYLLRELEREAPCHSIPIPNLEEMDEETKIRLRGWLAHTHLPTLEEMGFIEWDRDTETIDRGPNFDLVVPFLELIEAEDELAI